MLARRAGARAQWPGRALRRVEQRRRRGRRPRRARHGIRGATDHRAVGVLLRGGAGTAAGLVREEAAAVEDLARADQLRRGRGPIAAASLWAEVKVVGRGRPAQGEEVGRVHVDEGGPGAAEGMGAGVGGEAVEGRRHLLEPPVGGAVAEVVVQRAANLHELRACLRASLTSGTSGVQQCRVRRGGLARAGMAQI